jgi:hypothetical protein
MQYRISASAALAVVPALAFALAFVSAGPAAAQDDSAPMVITPHPQGPRQMPPPSNYDQPPPASYNAPPPSGYAAPAPPPGYGSQPSSAYGEPPPPSAYSPDGPGRPYEPAPESAGVPSGERYVPPEAQDQGTFSMEEIKETGHRFFGTISMGLARAIEYTFQRAGRPNGYILGEEAGGALVAGVRYGEGTLYTKDAGEHQLYWQGPSVGYDFGAEGSKTMVLVYDLRSPGEIFSTFAGVDGSAYLVGGVGVTFLARNHVILAPIRSGVGLRLGANVGYLKYTREPTWNPF